MSKRNESGFTLVEVVVVVAVIAILAAVLTPYITKYIDDSRVARAKSEAQVVGAAMANFYKDTGRWPNATNATTAPNVNFAGVHTGVAANAPTAALIGAATGWAAAGAANWSPLDTHLYQNQHQYLAAGETRWNGPYATQLPLDPWGRPYVVNAANLTANNIPVWVLSAGPNGVLNTNVGAAASPTTPQGDDVGFRLR